MPTTLLDIVRTRFGVQVDPDSNSGQILNSLTPTPDLAGAALSGKAAVAPLTFVPSPAGLSVRAAQPGDVFVFTVPSGPFDFTLKPAAGPTPLQVEITLLDLRVPMPFLRPASVTQDTLTEVSGDVVLHFPSLQVVVTAVPGAATAKLAPSHAGDGALQASMTPGFALMGSGADAVLGFGFASAMLKLDGPEPVLTVPELDVFVNPEGIPGLAMRVAVTGLTIGLGTSNSGLTGDFALDTSSGPGAAARPRFLRNASFHLRLNRNSVTLLKLGGTIDASGEVQTRLGGNLDDAPSAINYVLSLSLDDGWRAELALSGSGQDFLWRTRSSSPSDILRNTLGAYAVFSPLLAPSLLGAGQSDYVDLALSAGAAGALALSGIVKTRSVTLYGGELVIRKPPTGAPEAFLFFDLQTEIDVTTPFLATRHPLKVRHKAIGLRLDFGSNGASPSLRPVFDPLQGFTLDLSDPGTFEVQPAILGDILQPDAARMARDNPLNFEIDLITKADLGVVTIDRASVRIPIDPPGEPTLTGLGAHLNAGAIKGDGYLKISSTGFAGALDASLVSLGVRVGAGLRIEKANVLTGVLATFDAEWPIPIPIANSGLGLFGVLGLFAMHFKPDQGPNQSALEWFRDTAHGDPSDVTAWRGAPDWAFGVGAVIGTLEGGFLIHAKGMVVLELPGPRLLLVMNADILGKRPDKRGTDTGTLLAIIDISPPKFTIGVVVDYKIPILLEVSVPATAFFDADNLIDWFIDIGGIPDKKIPAKVKFLSVFNADGYLLFHGNGIPDFPPLADVGGLQGLSVAAGVRAALVWGPQDIGLYIKVAAQADVGISFKPFLIVGSVSVSGELHLFIASIGASATGDVTITPDNFYLKLTVCGEIDLFVHTFKGCVTLKLGHEDIALPPADPMIRALSLHSRTMAYLPGSGVDRPIDGSLGEAFHLENGQFVGDTPQAQLPVVPIDALPVLQFDMRPTVAPGCRFFEAASDIPSPLAPTDWARRGQRFYRYRLKEINLSATDANGAPMTGSVSTGDTPTVWWDRDGKPVPGDDNDVQLALLDWVPDPTPAAAERTEDRDTYIDRRWGDTCTPVADPAPVLWSFINTATGPSSSGWTLVGQVYPDPPGRQRSAPAPNILRVVEPWRLGNPIADSLVQVEPAYVRGAAGLRERVLVAPRTGAALAPRVPGDTPFVTLMKQFGQTGHRPAIDAIRLDPGGLRRIRGLFFAPRLDWIHGLFVLRALDAGGNGIGWEQGLDPTTTRVISNVAQLVPEWSDPTSPWFPVVDGTIKTWNQIDIGLPAFAALFFFEAKLPAGCGQVEISLRQELGSLPSHWGLLLVEALTEAEFARASFDETTQKTQIATINGALGADNSNRALLLPGATYTLEVKYDVLATSADEHGKPVDVKGATPTDGSQQFRFMTDARPPQRLDPWVLLTNPAPAQDFFFFDDPIVIVFATNATRKLFSAYGRELNAVVKASSGNHPSGGSGGDPFSMSLDSPGVALGMPPLVMTPFESSLREALADAPCLDATQTSHVHEQIKLAIPLDPLTNYVLDLEARPVADTDARPLFRRHFGTSRYASATAFAQDVNHAAVRHRRLADVTPLSNLAAGGGAGSVREIVDIIFEAALRGARWGDLARPSAPRVTVIWRDGTASAGAQPTALLIETPEPLWRSRDVPELGDDGDGIKRYRMVPKPWLEVIETTAGARQVSCFVHSTEGGRTLVLLLPNARGATMTLGLQRTHHQAVEGDSAVEMVTLLSVGLAHPPWEASA